MGGASSRTVINKMALSWGPFCLVVLCTAIPIARKEEDVWATKDVFISKRGVYQSAPRPVLNATMMNRFFEMNNASRQILSSMKRLYTNYEQAKEVLHTDNIAANLRAYISQTDLSPGKQNVSQKKSKILDRSDDQNEKASPKTSTEGTKHRAKGLTEPGLRVLVTDDSSLAGTSRVSDSTVPGNANIVDTQVSLISDGQSSQTLYAKELFLGPMTSCQHVTGLYEPRWLRMVIYCPDYWTNETIRSGCEAWDDHTESYIHELTSLPVQDQLGTVYANQYCAQCHDATRILPWSTNVVCKHDSPEVMMQMSMMKNMGFLLSYLQTPQCIRDIIPAIPAAVQECHDHTFHLSSYIRKDSPSTSDSGANDYPVSFNVLMNFDFTGNTHLLFSAGRQVIREELAPRCREWETYDTYMMKCRPITCSRQYQLSGNTCVRVANNSASTAADSITDLSQLRTVDQTAMVSLLVNITYFDYLIIKFQDTEKDIVPQIADHLNITLDRIKNLNITYESGSINGSSLQVTTLTEEQYASLFPPLEEPSNHTATTPRSWIQSGTHVSELGVFSGSVKGTSELLEVKTKQLGRKQNLSLNDKPDLMTDLDMRKVTLATESPEVDEKKQQAISRNKRETIVGKRLDNVMAEDKSSRGSGDFEKLSSILNIFERLTLPFQNSAKAIQSNEDHSDRDGDDGNDDDRDNNVGKGRNVRHRLQRRYLQSYDNDESISNDKGVTEDIDSDWLVLPHAQAQRGNAPRSDGSSDQKVGSANKTEVEKTKGKGGNKDREDRPAIDVTKYDTFALYHLRSQDLHTDIYISTPVNSRNERILLETQKTENVKLILDQRMVMRITFILVPPYDSQSNQEGAQTLVQKLYNLILEEQFSLLLNGNHLDVMAADNSQTDTNVNTQEFCPWGVEYTVLDDEFTMLSVDNMTLMYVNKTNSYIGVGRFDLFVIVSGSNSQDQTNVTDMIQYAFVCFMPRISQVDCNRIDLTAKEYYVAGSNRSIIFEEKEYDIFSYRVLNETTGAVQICVPQTFSTHHHKVLPRVITIPSGCSSDFNEALEAEGYMTFVLGRLSIAALITVLITYLLFPKLRNLPGVNTMNLTFSLLITQIIFSEGIIEDTKWLCSAVAVSLHYSLLVAHFWMNVMSYDVYRTFSRPTLLTHVREKRKYLPRYALYAWGVPSVIVSFCVFVDFSGLFDEVSIGYGGGLESPSIDFNFSLLNYTQSSNDSINPNGVSSGSSSSSSTNMCWITKPLATLVAFGAPILIIFLANCIFFAKTIISISKTAKIAKKSVATRHSSSSFHKMTGRSDVMLYLRMSTVMGFTWIFGLSSAILSSFAKPVTYTACIVIHVVGILFILLNTSQGIFIFGAFVCNRRVLGLYMSLLHKIKKFVLLQNKKTPSSLYTISSTLADSRNTIASNASRQAHNVIPSETVPPSAPPV